MENEKEKVFQTDGDFFEMLENIEKEVIKDTYNWCLLNFIWAFLVAQTVKNLPVNAGDLGLIRGSGRSRGEGTGYPCQYSSLENSVDRGVWQATVQGVAKSQTKLND